MLVALITNLFLGGGIEHAVLDYVKYIRGSVDDVVADEDRQSAAQATLREMGALTKEHTKANQKAFESLLSEIGEYDQDTGDTEPLWADYTQSVDAYNERMIDLRFELRDTLTRDEWAALFADNPE
jgi:hypothetical protein